MISKRTADGQEVVYGTAKRTLEKIVHQINRLNKFQAETEIKLAAKGLDPKNPNLPDSLETDEIVDEQENLIEDVLLAISVNIRIISELFPQRLKKRKVNVYDYDDCCIDKIDLNTIADLLLHNRYILVKGEYVVDLISDKKFMTKRPQMGLKINFLQYIAEVEGVVNGVTVKDLISRLWATIEKLSASSSIKDIVFLTQNLYTLGGLVVENAFPIGSGPLKTILDRVAIKHIERMYPQDSIPNGTAVTTQLIFGAPRFRLEPDLNSKQIRTVMQVNGSDEELVMGYKEFLSEVSKASGNMKLVTFAAN